MSQQVLVHPVVQKLNEERNEGRWWAREASGKFPDVITNGKGPLLGTDFELANALIDVERTNGLDGHSVIFGSSYLGVDSREVCQMLACLAATSELSELDSIKGLYFAEYNQGHRAAEFLRRASSAYGIDLGPLMVANERVVGDVLGNMANSMFLPMKYYQKPDPKALGLLEFGSSDLALKQLWIEAAANPRCITFADWRREVDRLTLARVLEGMGYDPGVITLVDYSDFVSMDSDEGRVNDISVEELISHIRESVTNSKKSLEGQHGDLVEDPTESPIFLRVVHHDGRRLGVTCDLEVVTLGDKREKIDDFYTDWILKTIRSGRSFGQIMDSLPVQLGGVGYYSYFEVLSRKREFHALMLVDDYPRAKGPIAAALAMRNLHPVIMPGARVGLQKAGNVGYSSPGEWGMYLRLLSGDGTGAKGLGSFVRLLRDTMKTGNASEVPSVTLDLSQGAAVDLVSFNARRTVLALAEALLIEVSKGGVYQLPLNELKANDQLRDILPQLLYAYRPESVGVAVNADIYDNLDTVEQIVRYLSTLREFYKGLGIRFDSNDVEYLLTETARDLRKAYSINNELESLLSDEEECAYWKNRVITILQIAVSHGFKLPSVEVMGDLTRSELRDFASGFMRKIGELESDRIERELTEMSKGFLPQLEPLSTSIVELLSLTRVYEDLSAYENFERSVSNISGQPLFRRVSNLQTEKIRELIDAEMQSLKKERKGASPDELFLEAKDLVGARLYDQMTSSYDRLQSLVTNLASESGIEVSEFGPCFKVNGAFDKKVLGRLNTLLSRVKAVSMISGAVDYHNRHIAEEDESVVPAISLGISLRDSYLRSLFLDDKIELSEGQLFVKELIRYFTLKRIKLLDTEEMRRNWNELNVRSGLARKLDIKNEMLRERASLLNEVRERSDRIRGSLQGLSISHKDLWCALTQRYLLLGKNI